MLLKVSVLQLFRNKYNLVLCESPLNNTSEFLPATQENVNLLLAGLGLAIAEKMNTLYDGSVAFIKTIKYQQVNKRKTSSYKQ